MLQTAATTTEERYAMPIRLKRILKEHSLAQNRWADAVQQTSGRSQGKPLSHAAASQFLNWGIFPRSLTAKELREQTEAFLRAAGVDDEEIVTVWEADTDAPSRGRHSRPPSVRRPIATHPRTVTRPADDEGAVGEFDQPVPEADMLSHAAKRHFKILTDPFMDDVQSADDVFESREHAYIRAAMFATAKHGGFLAVVGESGAGKTTLRRDLLDRISRERHPITVIQPRSIDKSRLSASAICDAIIHDVSAETPRSSLEAKARQIERLLVGSSRAGNTHVLIIEEAHDLSIRTLKYLKRFWELEDGFKKLLAIILVGQQELKVRLDERQNWDAREVIRRCEIAVLEPLDGDLRDYIELKFKRIGHELDDVFTSDAFDAIRERLTLRRRGTGATVNMHYPLVVNNLVTRAMNLAVRTGSDRVSAEIVNGV